MAGGLVIPWQLDIHLLDVGQGDCTLIVADNLAGVRRTMLIDAGHPQYGEVAHDYIVGTAGLPSLDHIVLTHYNEDHGGGLRALLLADDTSRLVETLTTVALPSAVGVDRPRRIASMAAAVCSAALGNYGPNAAAATFAANQARGAATAADTDLVAVNRGVTRAVNNGGPIGVASLLTNPYRRRGAARQTAVATAAGLAAGQAGAVLTNTIRNAVFGALQGGVLLNGARFLTGNIYNNTHVIDLGNTAMMPAGWNTAITGQFTIGGNAARAPGLGPLGIGRMRTPNPALGSEVLWSTGPGAMPPPAAAPRAYVVSCASQAWQGTGVAPFPIATGFPDNDTSIGLLIRFNNFYYYTAGDLPSVGENPLMTAIMGQNLPNPGGAPLAPPDRIGSFKCSHHGAAASTSAAFLAAGDPRTALVSCGFNLQYQHPADALVFRLHGRAGINRFYLTNCNFQSLVVAASMGNNQLLTAGNRSRVAGDNNNVNMAAGRNRGDIRLRITQAQSAAAIGARQYWIHYWEHDQVPAGMRNSPSIY